MTHEEIKTWLHAHNIPNGYLIHEDKSVSVSMEVRLTLAPEEKELGIQFSSINGDFMCFDSQLTSFKGFPEHIHGSLWCHNNQITSLEYCPKFIKGKFYCMNNPILALNQEHLPNYVGKDLHFSCPPDTLIAQLIHRYKKISETEYSVCISLSEIQDILQTQALYESFQSRLDLQPLKSKRKI